MWFIRVCNIGLDLENFGVFKGCNFWSLLGGVSNDMSFAHWGSSAYQNIITNMETCILWEEKGIYNWLNVQLVRILQKMWSSCSRVGPLFRPVSVVGWPTLKSIPFLKFFIIFQPYFCEKQWSEFWYKEHFELETLLQLNSVITFSLG